MNGANEKSVLSRPPKLSPLMSLPLGAVCIVLGFVIQGGLGGGLVGGGLGLMGVGLWDVGRLLRRLATVPSRVPLHRLPCARRKGNSLK